MKNKNKSDEIINTKLTHKEKRLIKKKANKYADGNASRWMRFAGINMKPKKSDLDKI